MAVAMSPPSFSASVAEQRAIPGYCFSSLLQRSVKAMLVLLKSTAALPLVATMVRERCAPSFSAASHTCVYSVCCVLSFTASLDAFRRLNQSVSSLATSNWGVTARSEEHTSELQSQSNLVCRLLLEKKKTYRDLDM